MDNKMKLCCSVGPLLYTPAIASRKTVNKMLRGNCELFSTCFDLEDSIADCFLDKAESELIDSLLVLSDNGDEAELPLIFVRPRSPMHLEAICNKFPVKSMKYVYGFYFPKFTSINAHDWLEALFKAEKTFGKKLWAMPVIESREVMYLETRVSELLSLKQIFASHSDSILMARVGAADFCSFYGIRRSKNMTAYNIPTLSHCLSDIINVLSRDIAVSGPVFEYYRDLENSAFFEEVELDIVNGFIGKTCIHPSQASAVKKILARSAEDVLDAKAIIECSKHVGGAQASVSGERMNEIPVHLEWAKKTLMLSEIYGVRQKEIN